MILHYWTTAVLLTALAATHPGNTKSSNASYLNRTAGTSRTPGGFGAARGDRGFGPRQRYVLEDTTGAPDPVDVQVADDAIIIDRKAPPNADALLGKIENVGNKKEKRYKFKPESEAVYYLYAKSSLVGGSTGWYITEEKKNGQEKPFLEGSFGLCDAMAHPPASANIGFKRCERLGQRQTNVQVAELVPTGYVEMLYRRALALITNFKTSRRSMSNDPGWVACTDGCCTMLSL